MGESHDLNIKYRILLTQIIVFVSRDFYDQQRLLYNIQGCTNLAGQE